ncbi:hypothetical protein KGF56_004866 [Candida oxycetoniae]|uniref:Uncharacterized protein n=1 Tax=Candida oxycetoniae TaxID=497107 RepID=A0AAI9SSW3_9ASCO|nr:uncharacterized protein KGF56_004866 [Candida oxycetoniae]KAI3402296.2 hypothetical protein KGF56_004866 [Candida oxycetoniae]
MFQRNYNANSKVIPSHFAPEYYVSQPTYSNHFPIVEQTHPDLYINSNALFCQDAISTSLAEKLLESVSTPQPPMSQLVEYLDPLSLSHEELSCMSKGLTNMKVRCTRDTNTFYNTEKLRHVGKTAFEFGIINRLKIFKTLKYLSNSSFEISSEVSSATSKSLIREFMKLNGLVNCVSVNREFLVNEQLSKELFELKKQRVFDATTVGCFYTMVGIVCANHRESFFHFMDKIISGKRGIIDILRRKNA